MFAYEDIDSGGLFLQRVPENGEPVSGHYWEPVFTDGYANLHIFSADDREFYRLEEFWRAAPSLESISEEEAAQEEPSAVA